MLDHSLSVDSEMTPFNVERFCRKRRQHKVIASEPYHILIETSWGSCMLLWPTHWAAFDQQLTRLLPLTSYLVN